MADGVHQLQNRVVRVAQIEGAEASEWRLFEDVTVLGNMNQLILHNKLERGSVVLGDEFVLSDGDGQKALDSREKSLEPIGI